ncbi:UDP-N-acetylmuramoyl-L-alanyl-D-glutamate--2,6-diaminopimelate ligase [Luteibacter jiangsuensis]|uniref:UDP-N-acetylmuramoyl-L-alanyl-D-glutamate--2,6-diaminopimelate ligase n=1 Tax=Luteibacter jiangsuensis TaxID=637577 RepID=A0ABT9T0H0_9GAMM|nr:UDP-N-acetylmuramoyl-L-alanyl-D-glutamate--2,6-diaminopimelate ligase [Luteibacter jiangsuensis]MDQ0010769.1 UDP-N-acetylmuramoyl-L-alanyl-D-glutamate--2,6-diaminopimelate ligase [Luteibacter jiangsuensis]
MRLTDLLDGFADASSAGDIDVSGLALDSREIVRGNAFVALRGTKGHGIEFAARAVGQGAVAILAEPPFDATDAGVPVITVDKLREKAGPIAARYYGDPSRALDVIGVTGTNGKTSTVQLIAQALAFLGRKPATIGTLGAGLHGAIAEGERTTPDAIRMQALLGEFRDAGATHVAMEVSSHALEQGRVNAIAFDVAVFTNLTRDHLDYHGTMEAYGAAKAKLFAFEGLRSAVINVDDPFGAKLAKGLGEGIAKLRVSMAGDSTEKDAEIRADIIVTSAKGLSFNLNTPWGMRTVRSALLGRFNVANLLSVAAVLGALGEPFDRIHAALEALQPVNGRMSRLGGDGRKPLVVVDYSHTPDALKQALLALRSHTKGKLICVFGAGGDRDQGKRPIMAGIAERLADVVIVTDDNPRSEDGHAIVAQIVAGFVHPDTVMVERDRAQAIALALADAKADDVVLIAGKGHETYQEGPEGKRPFDDLAVAREAMETSKKGVRA